VVDKDEKLSFRSIKRQEIGRHLVGYVSYSVFKVSGVMTHKSRVENDNEKLNIISIEVMVCC